MTLRGTQTDSTFTRTAMSVVSGSPTTRVSVWAGFSVEGLNLYQAASLHYPPHAGMSPRCQHFGQSALKFRARLLHSGHPTSVFGGGLGICPVKDQPVMAQ